MREISRAATRRSPAVFAQWHVMLALTSRRLRVPLRGTVAQDEEHRLAGYSSVAPAARRSRIRVSRASKPFSLMMRRN